MRATSVGEAEPSRQDRLKEKGSNPLPKSVRKEISALARKLKRDHRALFASDPLYRKRAGQFLTALLPPRPRRRGRPAIPEVTAAAAIRLLVKYRREYPADVPAQRWKRIYSRVIPGYAEMDRVQRKAEHQKLRDRVRARRGIRTRRIRARYNAPPNCSV